GKPNIRARSSSISTSSSACEFRSGECTYSDGNNRNTGLAKAPWSANSTFLLVKVGKSGDDGVSDGPIGPLGEAANIFPNAPKNDLERLINELFVLREVVLD